MHKINLSIIAAVAALAALPVQGYVGMQSMGTAPKSLKGKRITFFYEGAHRFVLDKDGTPRYSENKLTQRYVNFDSANSSTDQNGGKMVYERVLNEEEGLTLTDDCYSGSGYRTQGNPAKDSGTWTLYFELDDVGSAQYCGTEDGKTVVYEDVLFKVTPADQDATADVEDSPRSKDSGTSPRVKTTAPHSLQNKVVVLKPKRGQDLAASPWALSHMKFGRSYLRGGQLINHMVACKRFGQTDVLGYNWRNALNGETEPVLFPGNYDYARLNGRTARIQLGGASSTDAYYLLTFTTPTTGTLLFHAEDNDNGEKHVHSHIEGIPFEVREDF